MEKLSYVQAVTIIEGVVRFARNVSFDPRAAGRSDFMMPYTPEEIDQAWKRIQQGWPKLLILLKKKNYLT